MFALSFCCLITALIIFFVIWCTSRKPSPCPTSLSWLVERDNPFSSVTRSVSILTNSCIQEGMSVLDAGCGPGRVTIPLAKKVGPAGEVVALDIQSGMLAKAQRKAQQENISNIRFLHAGLGDKKLDHNKFDRVLLVTVMGEIPDKKAALAELFDALKPGGVLSVTELIFDPHYTRRSTVAQYACAAGFLEKNRIGNWLGFTMLFEKPWVIPK